MSRILVNGHPGGSVPAMDRAIQYGDGLFETIAVREGRPELWSAHMERLGTGCERLGISVPEPGTLLREALQLARGRECGVLKIILSRGGGGRGYCPPDSPSPTRIVSLHPLPEWPREFWSEGVVTRICATRLGLNGQLAGIKHLNRLEQVLARAEWQDPAIAEGLMLDFDGRLVEGTMSNLFLVRDGVLQTPDLSRCGVAGIMRGVVLEEARRRGIPCETGPLRREDLAFAQELFLTNSLIGIWPVRRVERRDYTTPGEITRLLQKDIEDIRSRISI